MYCRVLISFICCNCVRVLNENCLRRQVGKRGAAGSTTGEDIFSYKIFRLFPVLHSSTKQIEIKSSIVFSQSNKCIAIDIKKDGCSLYDCSIALSRVTENIKLVECRYFFCNVEWSQNLFFILLYVILHQMHVYSSRK